MVGFGKIMYLKNLTVLGFKSFAEKTVLNFQPGVTAIVGPNGCGKSNVSDAIRWVLGEQSAKALRGGEMADVIFNGTDSRKPLGMAEVSLTVGGVDPEGLAAAGVKLVYDEVTLTRRVFRDGGSEYFINRTPCRLRDIQQLFMGTGVGRTSYSIMAQGNITQILSSKPEDRRMIFEEAAGEDPFGHDEDARPGRANGFVPDGFLCLALGANKQDGSTISNRIADDIVSSSQVFDRLLQVNDVNAVALGKNIRAHERIPLVGTVTKVHPAFQQGFH